MNDKTSMSQERRRKPRRTPVPDAPIALDVTGGLHVGGHVDLGDGAIVVIGSGDNADLVLADEGVCERHCVVWVQRGKALVRALEGPVDVPGRRVEPPSSAALAPGDPLAVGEAQLEIRVVEEAGVTSSTAEPEEPAGRRASEGGGWRRSRPLAAVLSLTAVLVSASALTVVLLGSGPEAQSKMSRPVVQAGSAPAPDDKAAGDASESNGGSERGSPKGSVIAKNVQDVLRLSGITAKTEYVGDGTVKVIGHLGEGKKVRNAIRSRAMSAVHGLDRVVTVNHDRPERDRTRSEPAEPNPVVQIVSGSDPYLILDDGDRIYPGATLSSGTTLVAIEGEKAVIEKGDAKYRVDAMGKTLQQLGNEQGAAS